MFSILRIKKSVWLCGTKFRRSVDKFKETGFIAMVLKIVKTPIIEGSTVVYECKVVDKLETGDHIIYVGK